MAVDIAVLGLEVRSDGVVVASDRLKQLTAEGGKAEQATGKLSSSFANATKYIQAAVAAMAAWKLTEYAKEATILAARVETLGVVMKVVGNNAGYTGSQMEIYDKAVQKMGITTQESRANLIKMAGSQMELAKATQLARVAQDAAVIGNINSSEAFGRMIQGIRSGETEILKNIGINVQFEQAYKKAAATLGKTSEQMTGAEKVTARMNAVLDYGKNIAGAYEASMGTAGKQLNSMSRYTEELRLKFGETFTPALSFVVVELTNALKDADTMLGNNKITVEEWGQNFKTVVVSIAAEITRLSMLIDKAGGSMTSAAMLLFGPGAAMGNENSKKQFERLAQANLDYEARYKAGEDRLARLAESLDTKPTSGRTSAQEQAAIEASAQRKAKEAAEAAAAAAKKGAEAAQKWASTYEQLRKEIDLMNPSMTELDRKILDVTQKYADLERKKGANIAKLRELKAEHIEAVRSHYDLAEAIKATSKEFEEYNRIMGEESSWSQTADNIDEQHRLFIESVRLMDTTAKASKEVSDAVYDVGRAYENLSDQAAAIDAIVNKLYDLKGVQESITDTNIGLINDPYVQQMAMLEERYRREKELINEKMAALEDSNLTETAMYKALNDKLLIMGVKLNKDLADSQREQAKAGWDSVVSQAQKAFPKLVNIDKLLTTAFKDHTVTRLDASGKAVKDETASNMAMYGAYADAVGGMFAGMAASQDQSSREGFETAKAFNMAAAVMSTASGIMNQYSSGDPYTANFRAAIVAAVGAIQIAKIASTSFGGGGALAPSAPSGSFAGSGGSSSSSTGLSNLKTPLMSLEDTRTAETYERMIASSDSVVVAIGRLSKSIDDLTAIFEEGGAGYALATNAPRTALTVGGTQKSPFGTSALFDSLGNALGVNGVESFFKTVGTLGIADIVESMFASENKITESGMALAVQNGVIVANQMLRRETGSWWSGSQTHYEYTPDTELQAYMQSVIDPFIADIQNMAMTLGTTVDFSKFSSDLTNIQVAGKTTEEVAKQLEDWTLETLQGLALTVEGLAGDGGVIGNYDDAYAALKRLNDGIVTLKDSFLLIGKTVVEGTLVNAQAADALITSMGGIDDFNEAIDTYFTSMFTDAEQDAARTAEANRTVKLAFLDMQSTIETLAKSAPEQWEQIWTKIDDTTYLNTLKEIPNVFDQLLANGGVPKTREEFRNLVNSLDVTTDAGASTFAALMNISEAFGTVMDAADAARKASEDLEVRYLNATGNTAAADALERQLANQRELQDAIDAGFDASYIARLQEVQSLEVQAAAAEAAANANQALSDAVKSAESSVSSISTAFDNLVKSQITAAAQANGAMVGGVQLSAAEYKSYGSFVTFLDQAAGELQKIADMGFPEELQAAVDQITAMVDTASKQLAGQVASARILAGDAAGALAAYQKWTMPKDGFTNPDGSFNAGAFNSQYLRNQAKVALELGSQASANALNVVDAMRVIGTLDYSHNTELIGAALRDNITVFSNGFSAEVGKTITDNMRPALDVLSGMQVAREYAPQGPGVNSIAAAQMQANALNGLYIGADRTQYHGTAEIAFGKGLDALNQMMEKGVITSDDFATSLNRLELATGVTADTVMTLVQLEEAQAAAAEKVKTAGISSMNYYLTQISSMGKELMQVAIDTGTALGKVTESIGRMKSWSDVLTYSVNAAGDFADLAQNKDRADISRAIAAAAADAQTRLTTADAAAAQPVLQGMTAFAGMDTVKLRDISLLIDGLKQFDPESFEQAFTRISAALVDGVLTIDQYAALYSYSMDVYQGTAKNALEVLKQTGSDAMQILENAINKAKEAQQVIVDQLRTLSDSLHSLIEGLQTPTDETLINRQAAQAQLRELVASNTLPAPGEFDAAMRALSEPSKQLFGSFESYAEDFYKTAIDLSTLSTRTDSQLSIAEQEIQRLDDILKTAQDQWDVAMGTKLAVMSVEEAVVNLQNAIVALSQGQTPSVAIAGLNSFAVGTNYVPYDMVAQIHQGERIIPRADNYRLMQGNDEMVAELKALREEVSQLRAEQRSQAAVLATNTDKTAKAMTRVMPDGDALAVRIAA